MDLRKIYQTLLRRGMPEHPSGVRYFPEQRFGTHGWCMNAATEEYCSVLAMITEDDAHAMITMWALAWYMADPDRQPETYEAGVCANHLLVTRDSAMLGNCSRDGFTGGYYHDGRVVDILDAIVVATSHLEPK